MHENINVYDDIMIYVNIPQNGTAMGYTASFTDARVNFTQITDLVMNERVPVTVFKRNKPAFKIVPIESEAPAGTSSYLSLADDLMDEYVDVFEALAK